MLWFNGGLLAFDQTVQRQDQRRQIIKKESDIIRPVRCILMLYAGLQ
jgi:hypothetical protein